MMDVPAQILATAYIEFHTSHNLFKFRFKHGKKGSISKKVSCSHSCLIKLP